MSIAGFADLESLERQDLLVMAHEYMLSGFHGVKATGITLAMRGGLDDDASTEVSIDQWMGASPVYTGRMRDVMGIEGHDVPAIMKALQLDVGFCHEYMDVAYKIDDPQHGEFWLLHCGALIDMEPLGEARVFSMCHTIEDPTFDATALATNPRARIRPIHRPPRVPGDRHPHCHWTLVIDEANEPVGPIALTEQIAGLPLSSVPNSIVEPSSVGRDGYSGDFDPQFRLRQFTDGALAAAAREFQMQTHLLAASFEETVAQRVGEAAALAIIDEAWLGAAWIIAERLGQKFDLGEGAAAVGAALRITSAIPPGFERTVVVEGDKVTCTLDALQGDLLRTDHRGWCGSLARGADGLIAGTVGGLGYEASDIVISTDGPRIRTEATISTPEGARSEPDVVALGRIGRTANWEFDLAK
jgi:hypothetical protein